VARGVSILSLLVALLVAGWLLTTQQRSGPSGHTASQVVARAQQAASRLTFQQAQVQLEQFHALNSTYAGASTAGFDVTLVRADASSYCIQAGAGESVSHLAGPGGAPGSGPC
jgi:Tfp pilus assembly protein PilE